MDTELILGNSYVVFAGFTLFCMCGCAMLGGMTVARAWRPARMALPFAISLGLLDRGLVHLLFGGNLLSPGGLVIDTYCILMATLLGYRHALARQLAQQYPWMYRRFLIFGWRRIRRAGSAQI